MSRWSTVRLGDILTIRNGFAFDSKKFGETGKPLIRIRNLKGGSVTETRFSGEYDPVYVVKPGDLLVGMDGEFRTHRWSGAEALLNQRVCRLENFRDDVSSEFIEYGLNRFLSDIEERTTFTTVKHISAKQILAIQFPLPPLDEQKRIVAKLDQAQSKLDRLESKLDLQICAIGDLGRAALDQQMTVGQSEPRFSGAESADTPVDSEPLAAATDWPKVRLGDVAQILNGRAYAKEELLESGRYRVLRVGNFFSNRSWYWSDLELAADKYCEPGDLLYAWSASFGPRIWEGDRTIFHYHIWNIKEDATAIDRRFLFWWLTWDVEKIKAAAGTGSTMMHVTKGSMESRVLALPSLIEQRNLAAKLDGLLREQDSYRKSLDQKRSLASALRDKILTSAFSGDI